MLTFANFQIKNANKQCLNQAMQEAPGYIWWDGCSMCMMIAGEVAHGRAEPGESSFSHAVFEDKWYRTEIPNICLMLWLSRHLRQSLHRGDRHRHLTTYAWIDSAMSCK